MFIFTGIRVVLCLGYSVVEGVSIPGFVLCFAITIWSEMLPLASRVMYTGSRPGFSETQIFSQFDNIVFGPFNRFDIFVLGFRP